MTGERSEYPLEIFSFFSHILWKNNYFVSFKFLEERGRPVQATSETSTKKSKPDKMSPTLQHLQSELLTKIFAFLSPEELVNIAELKVFDPVVLSAIFKKQFGETLILVNNKYDRDNGESKSKKLLKHFGDSITKLEVIYINEYIKHNMVIDGIIIKQCVKSLLEIHFYGADVDTLLQVREPFLNVRIVRFDFSRIRGLLRNFCKWFPNAHTLKWIRSVPIYDRIGDTFQQNFPNIKHFEIDDPRFFKAFAVLNPQLESLRIGVNGQMNFDYSLFSCINENLPILEKLHLDFFGTPSMKPGQT